MRGLVGLATVMTVLAWFTLRSAELIGDLQQRVELYSAAAAVREDALDLDAEPLVARGRARADWKALLGTDETLPSGVKQRAFYAEQTRRLLAGEPVTAAERRAAAAADADTLHAAAARRHAELVAKR